jgi:hypothetical protein
MSGGEGESRGITAVTVVAPDAALRVHALNESRPLVGVAGDATVRGILLPLHGQRDSQEQ